MTTDILVSPYVWSRVYGLRCAAAGYRSRRADPSGQCAAGWQRYLRVSVHTV